MLWSPIVRSGKTGSLYNQMNDILEIQKKVKQDYGANLVIIINEEFLKCIEALRKVALERTDEVKTPTLRFLQIEEKLKVHVSKIEKLKSSNSQASKPANGGCESF